MDGENADAAARFTALVADPGGSFALDEAALLVAAHAYPGLDVDEWLGRLDALAKETPSTGAEAVARFLFGPAGFAGNDADYYDPRNSFLNDVLARRLGIPITLAIVAIEVGRRVGVPFVGVGMPGHFLVRTAVDDLYVDPFGGALLDLAGCEAWFHARHGADVEFDESFLAAVGSETIVARVLANLKGIYRARRDRKNLEWVLRLRLILPSTPFDERRELASVLAADGRFGEAASELEDAAERVAGTDKAEELAAAAIRLRARLN